MIAGGSSIKDYGFNTLVLGGSGCVFSFENCNAARYRCPEFLQKGFRLIFMDIHRYSLDLDGGGQGRGLARPLCAQAKEGLMVLQASTRV